MRVPSIDVLNGYVGKHISEICGCGYHDDSSNHCAHFACHVTQLHFGLNCFGMTGRGSAATSANIRVHQVFAHCHRVGVFSSKPADLVSGFIFVTQAANVDLATKTMANVPKKHVGMFNGAFVWQYKNRLRQVIRQTPDEFLHHYEGSGFQTFYGEVPY